MNWMKKNVHISILLGACVLFAGYLLITDPGEITYTEIHIQHGDSLWSLGEQHRGKMSTDEWIRIVKHKNELTDAKIVAGESLVIPVVGDQAKPINKNEIARNTQ